MSTQCKWIATGSHGPRWQERRGNEMTCEHPSLSPTGGRCREPRALRGTLVSWMVSGDKRSCGSIGVRAPSYRGFLRGSPSRSPARHPRQMFLMNHNPALAASWSRGWSKATDTADPTGPWSRIYGSAVSGRLALNWEPTRQQAGPKFITKIAPPSHPRPVMAARQVTSHGHCGPDGSMVSDPRGPQCPVGSPLDRKGL